MSTQDSLWARIDLAPLITEFAGHFGPETIERLTRETLATLKERATIETYLPVLTARLTRERLRALARPEHPMTSAVPEILFMCIHNAGGSQIAARLAEALAAGRLTVRSAGSEPEDHINPVVAQAMAEIGLEMGDRTPVRITDHAVRAADVVVTMGCGDACPLYPGKRYVDWQVPDPAGQDLPAVRRIRDEIRVRVEELLRDVGIEPAGDPA